MRRLLLTFLCLLIYFSLVVMDDDIHVAFSADAQVATENRISQTYINGDRFEGEVFNGMRNGKGVYIWASGERYEGDFVDNQRTGKGILL